MATEKTFPVGPNCTAPLVAGRILIYADESERPGMLHGWHIGKEHEVWRDYQELPIQLPPAPLGAERVLVTAGELTMVYRVDGEREGKAVWSPMFSPAGGTNDGLVLYATKKSLMGCYSYARAKQVWEIPYHQQLPVTFISSPAIGDEVVTYFVHREWGTDVVAMEIMHGWIYEMDNQPKGHHTVAPVAAGSWVFLCYATGTVEGRSKGQRWSFQGRGQPIVRTPAVISGQLLVPYHDGVLQALDIAGGNPLWQLNLAEAVGGSAEPVTDVVCEGSYAYCGVRRGQRYLICQVAVTGGKPGPVSTFAVAQAESITNLSVKDGTVCFAATAPDLMHVVSF